MTDQRLDLGGGQWRRWTETGIGPQTAAVVLLLHGRNEFLDKYDEVIAKLAARGLGMIAFDWRGQGLSSRFLANCHKGHIEDFETYLSDLELVLNSVVRPRWDRKAILLAHSTGGNVGLRCLVRRPDDFASAIFVSPMWDLPRNPIARAAMRLMTTLGTAFRLGAPPIPNRSSPPR